MSEHHNHSHLPHTHSHAHAKTDNIRLAFFVNLFFTIIEIFGGLMTNSVAILSDALHDLGDSLSLGLAWHFQKLSQKEKNKRFTFGYGRFSIIGAIINSLVLTVGSLFILFETIPRLIAPQMPDAQGMLYLAILGILFNGLAVLRLKKGISLNEKVVMLHLLEDVLGWTAILVGSIVMLFFHLPVLDPILSILIAVYILFNVFKNMKTAFKIILQGAPPEISVTEIEKKISAIEGIDSVHDIHLWSLDGVYNVLTIHVVLKNIKSLDSMSKFKKLIREKLISEHIQHTTIEFEGENEECTHLDC